MKVWKVTMSIWWEVNHMRKLLHANALRLRKSKCFWLGILFCALMGGSSPLMSYIDMKTVQERYDASYIIHLDGGCFSIEIGRAHV